MKRRHWTHVQSPVLQPVWLRAAITVVCLGWALLELRNGAFFWAILFGAAGIYLAYQFFVVWDPADPDTDKGDEP